MPEPLRFDPISAAKEKARDTAPGPLRSSRESNPQLDEGSIGKNLNLDSSVLGPTLSRLVVGNRIVLSAP